MNDPILTLKELLEKKRADKPDAAAQALALLDSRRVRRANRPPEILPALTIDGVPIAKPGDITAISAQAKSGKTAFINGIIAAAICSETGKEADTFGVKASSRPPGAVIVWVDTEQSEEDAWANLDRAGRRAECKDDPEWIRAYYLVGETPTMIRTALKAEFARLSSAGTPVWFFVIDGITDLMVDPNSIEESQEVCTEIRAYTRAHTCPGIVVIHRNEGEKAGGDARGHIGKELNRKASVVLSLEKDSDDVTTVWTHKSRGAPVKKSEGPRFEWSELWQMHRTSTTGAKAKQSAKEKKLRDLFLAIFDPQNSPKDGGVILKSYGELLSLIQGCARKTAEAKITEAIKLEIIIKLDNGLYKLA